MKISTSVDRYWYYSESFKRRICYDQSLERYPAGVTVLTYAQEINNISKTCGYFGIPGNVSITGEKLMSNKEKKGLSTVNPAPPNPL